MWNNSFSPIKTDEPEKAEKIHRKGLQAELIQCSPF